MSSDPPRSSPRRLRRVNLRASRLDRGRTGAPRRFRSVVRLGLAGAILVALPLTTACQNRIGLAASVGSRQLETSELTSVTDRSAAALSSTGTTVPADQEATLQRGVLNLLVREALLDEIAKAQNISVSDAEVASERSTEAKAAGGEKALITQSEQGGVSAQDLDLVVREKVLINKLQAKFGSSDQTAFANALTAAAAKIHVRVNPRFGSWDTKTLSIVGAPNDLSSTVTKK